MRARTKITVVQWDDLKEYFRPDYICSDGIRHEGREYFETMFAAIEHTRSIEWKQEIEQMNRSDSHI